MSFRQSVLYYWQVINALSIDVAAGACGMAWMLSVHLWGGPASSSSLSALFFSVCLIYLADHLADAAKAGANALTFRHNFCRRHRRLLMGALPVLLLAGVLCVAFLPVEKQTAGMMLLLICGLYLLAVQRFKIGFLKEFFVAFCYTAGVMLASFPIDHQVVFGPAAVWIALGCFMLLMSSLLLFALYDEHRDQQAGMSSAVWILGSRNVRIIAWVSCLLSGGAFVLAYQEGFAVPGLLACLLMVLAQGYLLQADRSIGLPEEGRLPGDALFLLPWLSLLF